MQQGSERKSRLRKVKSQFLEPNSQEMLTQNRTALIIV